MADEGKKLTQCLCAVSAFGKDLNALTETLNELILSRIGHSQDPDFPCKIAGDLFSDEQLHESGWLTTDCAYSLPLMDVRLKRINPEMYFAYR